MHCRRLRCDRTLPSCNNCLSRPDVEHCDYSNPRHSRCGGRRSCRSELATAPAPAAGPAHPPTPPELPDAAEDEEEEEEGDDDGGSQNAGEGERSERASEKTMREKLERLERMIASLMESKACRKQSGAGSCSGKKLQKERQPSDDGVKSLAASTSTMQRLLGPREGESMWSTLLNEVSCLHIMRFLTGR